LQLSGAKSSTTALPTIGPGAQLSARKIFEHGKHVAVVGRLAFHLWWKESAEIDFAHAAAWAFQTDRARQLLPLAGWSPRSPTLSGFSHSQRGDHLGPNRDHTEKQCQ
jgi:hypothetical protein